MYTAQMEADARAGTAEDIATLIRLFVELDSDGRASLIDAATRAFAAKRLRQPEADVDAWLDALADSTLPRNAPAAELISHASDFEPSAQQMILDTAPLSVVLSVSDTDQSTGYGMLARYNYILGTRDSGICEMRQAAEFLCVNVNRGDFEEPCDDSDDGWRFDKEAWQAEVDRQCASEFAWMVVRWRRAFFAALLKG